MSFLEEHTITMKIKDQQMYSFPLTHSLCSRKELIGENEYQNISYPKAAMRDYNILLQYFNKFQYLRTNPTIYFPREVRLVLPKNSRFGTQTSKLRFLLLEPHS